MQGPNADPNVYFDGAFKQEAFHNGVPGSYSLEGPQAVDGSAICNDKASCKTLAATDSSWGCAYSKCYRKKGWSQWGFCEPDPLKAKVLNRTKSSWHWESGPSGYKQVRTEIVETYSDGCKGAYVCEDDSMPANGRAVPSTWKSCVLPVPSNGVYDCKDYLDDDENLINGGHCNQMKCDTGHHSEGAASCTCGVDTIATLQCVPDTCEASSVPTNGQIGDCTSTLAHDSTRTPTCDEGFHLT